MEKNNTSNFNPGAINPEEFAVAAKAALSSEAVYVHKLSSPLTYGVGNEAAVYHELTFSWGKLSGKDALDIENELQQQNKPVIVASFSGEYLIRMAAKACEQPIGSDALLRIPIADFNKIRSRARSFLLKSEL